MKLSIHLTVILMTAVWNPGSSKFSGYYKHDTTIKSVIRDIISQNQLKGFLIANCITYRKNSVISRKCNDDIIRQAVKVATVSLVDNSWQRSRYVRNISRYIRESIKMKSSEEFLIQTHMTMNENTYMIIILDLNTLKSNFESLVLMQYYFQSVQGVSKYFFIYISNGKTVGFARLLKGLARMGFYDIDLLEVKRNRKSKLFGFKCYLHQLNPFNGVFKRSIYKAGAKCFPLKNNNFYGHSLHVRTNLKKSTSMRTFHRHSCDVDFIHYARELYPIETIVKLLNGTCRFILDNSRTSKMPIDIDFCPIYLLPHVFQPIIYHPLPMPAYFYAPSIYDDVNQQSYSSLLFCSLTIILSVFVFWVFSRLFRLDQLTWDPTIIFSMIINVANPRYPINFGESFWFLTLIMVGFFFGCDLIFGMTSVTISSKVERDTETLSDLIDNNVTFMFTWINKDYWKENDLKSMKFKQMNMRHPAEYGNHLSDLIEHKNVSVSSYPLFVFGAKVPQRLQVAGMTCCKESQVQELRCDLVVLIERNKPWTPGLRYNLMRFYECHLFSLPILEEVQNNVFRLSIGDMIEHQKRMEYNREDRLSEPIENFYLLIVIGCSVSLLVLLSEMYIFHRTRVFAAP